jgi:hypothetical protein
MKKYRQFLKLYLWITAVMALPLFVNLIFINNAHEHTTFREIVKIQHAKNAIYGTALNQNTFAYKIELVRHAKPKIIALGSSRILEVREEFFNTPFVNCGGAMNNLEEGKVFLVELFRYHKPEILLLGLDFWWFSDLFSQRETFDYHRNTGADLTLDKLIKPYDFLISSKISPRDYLQILLLKNDKNHITNYNNLGFTAIKRSDGFRKDGSYLYASTISGFAPEGQRIIGFNDRLDPKRRFEFGVNISHKRLTALSEIIKLCIDNNVAPVIIIPPVSSVIYQRMFSQQEKYGYVLRFQEYVKSLPVESYDFHDIKKVESTDCECIDGFHIGDVAYQKILLKILNQNPSSVIRNYLNISLMERMVRENDGKVMTIFEADRGKFNFREIDFLKLGCRKN